MSRLLPCDLWFYIGLKLDSSGDRIRFRAVSKSWRSLLPFRQPPWLMLAQDEREPDIQHDVEEEEESKPLWTSVLDSSEEFFPPPPPPRGFVCLTDQKVCEIDFPELDRVRTVGCTGNWLITMHLDRTLRMLNPFSRQQIHLPPPRTFENRDNLEARDDVTPEDYRDALVRKVVLSSPPSCDGGGDWVAIAIHHSSHTLAIARPGDALWTTVKQSFWVDDVIFYKQQFYAIHEQGRLMVCDIDGDLHLPKFSYLTHPIFTSKEKGYYHRKHYLVEWLGEILYIVKFLDQYENPDNYKTNKFQVYKFDQAATKFIEMKSLGEHSLFLGHNTSISVRASDYDGLVKKNCIYFTDDYAFGYMGMCIPGGHDMGVFDLEDKSITPHYKGMSTSLYSPPVWVVPT